jgi:hypothetical protein
MSLVIKKENNYMTISFICNSPAETEKLNPEDGGSRFLRYVRTYLPTNDTM